MGKTPPVKENIINKLLLKGRLVRPMTVRSSENGTQVGFVTLAVWKGMYKDVDQGAEFFDIKVFGQTLTKFQESDFEQGTMLEVNCKVNHFKRKGANYPELQIVLLSFNKSQEKTKDEFIEHHEVFENNSNEITL